MKVVLVHMPNESYYAGDTAKPQALRNDVNSLNILLDFALEYPKIQFVLAHSLYDPFLLHALLNRFGNALPANVWLETSAVFAPRSNIEKKADLAEGHIAIVNAWRKIGMQKVLYGSDNSIGGKIRSIRFESFGEVISFEQMQNEMLSCVTESPYLNQDEINMIIKENGEKFAALIF